MTERGMHVAVMYGSLVGAIVMTLVTLYFFFVALGWI